MTSLKVHVTWILSKIRYMHRIYVRGRCDAWRRRIFTFLKSYGREGRFESFRRTVSLRETTFTFVVPHMRSKDRRLRLVDVLTYEWVYTQYRYTQ